MVVASQRASQDFPTFGAPARMCRPCEMSESTTKFSGSTGMLIRVSPSMVLRGWMLLLYIWYTSLKEIEY